MSAFFRIVSVGGRQWWVMRSHEQKEACHSVFCGQSAVDSIDAITDSAIVDLDEILNDDLVCFDPKAVSYTHLTLPTTPYV